MLVKLIIADVKPAERDRFSRGQRAWEGLRAVDGFQGQTGGWCVDDAASAVIIGWWANRHGYDSFMANHHDAIFARGAQAGTYRGTRVSLWERTQDIPGRYGAPPQAVAAGAFLRIAICQLAPGRQEHFVDVQRNIWNPGMAGAGGLAAGVFCKSVESSDTFLVCTLWESEDDHRRYRECAFPELAAKAQVELDRTSIQGQLVRIEPDWRVEANRPVAP